MSSNDNRTTSFQRTKLVELYRFCETTLGTLDYQTAQSPELAGLQLLSEALPSNGPIPKERIYPYLERIERFMNLFTDALNQNQHSTAIIWGVIRVTTDVGIPISAM